MRDNRVPAIAETKAIIKAGVKPFNSKSLKSLSAILIITAVTINRTKNDKKPSVRMFSGKRSSNPIVAFRIPITKATSTAVPKLLILMPGSKEESVKSMPALTNNPIIKFMNNNNVNSF